MATEDETPRRGWVLGATAAVARHPTLWPAALRQAWRLRVPGWWRRAPFVPVPDRAYLRFRALTAYGDADASPEPADVITYLRWSRGWDAAVRSSSAAGTGPGRTGRVR